MIVERIDELQSAGRNIYLHGFTDNGRYCLIVDVDNDQCSVAPVGTVNGLGRWECDGRPDEFLSARFPNRIGVCTQSEVLPK